MAWLLFDHLVIINLILIYISSKLILSNLLTEAEIKWRINLIRFK